MMPADAKSRHVQAADGRHATLPKEPILAMRGITKRFPGLVANSDVCLDVYGGEVHALLGENGAGKSTLMKILYGFYLADSGEIRLEGRPVQIRSPHDARRLRIGMVFQDFTLIPAFTVLENIALFLPDLGAVPDRRGIARRIEEVSARYDLHVDPQSPVWQLSVGEQQRVEILKLLLAESRVLILDEPTKVLAPHEIEGLYRIFDKLRADSYAVVFITHKLQEVLTCANRITVLRKGSVAGSIPVSEASEDRLVEMMFGVSSLPSQRERQVSETGGMAPLLELKGFKTPARGTSTGLQEIDLAVRPGEIVGVAGVSGNGQKELGDAILGLEPCSGGQKLLMGEDATRWSVAKVRDSGVAFIPEDPLAMAAVPFMSILENMVIGDSPRYSCQGGLAIDWESARADLGTSLSKLGFTIPPAGKPLAMLSGGNVQRFILARELAGEPKLIVTFYPTRGLDVPSANAARNILSMARDRGAGVLLISEDLGELFDLSDRLVVIRHGEIVGEFRPQETSTMEVGYLMTGAEVQSGSCG